MKIDSYKFGEIVIDGQTYDRDLLILADRVASGWWRAEGHKLTLADLGEVLADPPQVLVVGTGRYGRLSVLPETQQALAAHIGEGIAEACGPAAPRSLGGRKRPGGGHEERDEAEGRGVGPQRRQHARLRHDQPGDRGPERAGGREADVEERIAAPQQAGGGEHRG